LGPLTKKKKIKKSKKIFERKQKIIAVRRGYQSLEQLRTELNSSKRTRIVL
jgi:hypothetical protein